MIKLDKKHKNKLNQATTLQELFPFVQNAIELEHATIPPYLTAMFSLKPGTEREIWDIIHSIVIEEMMHMTISSNIMNAIGGSPDINKAKFVPEYPGALPMGIGEKEGLIVNLTAYSQKQVHDCFMEIEEPEEPLDLNTRKQPVSQMLVVEGIITELPEPTYDTIGEFYEALKKQILKINPGPLPGDASKQVTSPFFDSSRLFPVTTGKEAAQAIDIIVEEGEGSTKSPKDGEGEFAHYYKFEELYRGIRLAPDPGAEYGYSFSGPAIPFNPDNVWPIKANTKAAMFTPGSPERRKVDQFNTSYRSLLNGLHNTFNGNPDFLSSTIGLMFDIKLYAEKICATPFPGEEGVYIGPTFEFIAPAVK